MGNSDNIGKVFSTRIHQCVNNESQSLRIMIFLHLAKNRWNQMQTWVICENSSTVQSPLDRVCLKNRFRNRLLISLSVKVVKLSKNTNWFFGGQKMRLYSEIRKQRVQIYQENLFLRFTLSLITGFSRYSWHIKLQGRFCESTPEVVSLKTAPK